MNQKTRIPLSPILSSTKLQNKKNQAAATKTTSIEQQQHPATAAAKSKQPPTAAATKTTSIEQQQHPATAAAKSKQPPTAFHATNVASYATGRRCRAAAAVAAAAVAAASSCWLLYWKTNALVCQFSATLGKIATRHGCSESISVDRWQWLVVRFPYYSHRELLRETKASK